MRTVLAGLLAVGMVGTVWAGEKPIKPNVDQLSKLLDSTAPRDPFAQPGEKYIKIDPQEIYDGVAIVVLGNAPRPCYIDDYLPTEISGGTPDEMRKAHLQAAAIIKWGLRSDCKFRSGSGNS